MNLPIHSPHKRIILLHDLFSSSNDLIIEKLAYQLSDYQVVVPQLPDSPTAGVAALQEIIDDCEIGPGFIMPTVVVSFSSSAIILGNVRATDKLCVMPFYHTSEMLATILGDKVKCEIPLLIARNDGVDKLSITHNLIDEYRELESRISVNDSGIPIFLADRPAKEKVYVKQRCDSIVELPGETLLDDGVIEHIKELVDHRLS